MDSVVTFIISNAQWAHWLVFFSILLAGFNLPVSLDLILIISAVLAATVVPENTLYLFLSVFFGALFSAWIAYGMGRILGPKLFRFRLFSQLLTPARLEKMKKFHERFGFWSLIIGRFIPFGVRNCIFMTAGLTKMPFSLFIFRDAIACFLWSAVSFGVCFFLGKNYSLLVEAFKTFNLFIFGVFSVTLISWIWYKKGKKRSSETRNETG